MPSDTTTPPTTPLFILNAAGAFQEATEQDMTVSGYVPRLAYDEAKGRSLHYAAAIDALYMVAINSTGWRKEDLAARPLLWDREHGFVRDDKWTKERGITYATGPQKHATRYTWEVPADAAVAIYGVRSLLPKVTVRYGLGETMASTTHWQPLSKRLWRADSGFAWCYHTPQIYAPRQTLAVEVYGASRESVDFEALIIEPNGKSIAVGALVPL